MIQAAVSAIYPSHRLLTSTAARTMIALSHSMPHALFAPIQVVTSPTLVYPERVVHLSLLQGRLQGRLQGLQGLQGLHVRLIHTHHRIHTLRIAVPFVHLRDTIRVVEHLILTNSLLFHLHQILRIPAVHRVEVTVRYVPHLALLGTNFRPIPYMISPLPHITQIPAVHRHVAVVLRVV